MAFPTIPTAGAGRVLTTFQADATSPRTFPNLSSLTKNSGDLLIAIIACYQSSLTANIFGTWGGGFSEIRDIGVASQMCLGVAWKISDGTETGTFTVAQAGTITGHAGMILLSIPGAHGTTAPEVTSALANGTAAAADPAALNPAGWDVEDTLWIAVGANGETSLTGSYTGMGLAAGPPSNYTNAVSTGESADVIGAIALAVAFRQNAVASEDVGTWSSIDLSNARNVAAVIAVRPATAAPQNPQPTALALTFTGATPTVTTTANTTSLPSALALTWTGSTPTVTKTDNMTSLPTAAALTWTGATPTVTATDTKVSLPTALSLTFTGSTPTVAVTDQKVSLPTALALAWTGATPDVAAGVSDNKTAEPTALSLTFTGSTPTVAATDNKSSLPTALALAWTGSTPTVATTTNVTTEPTPLPLIWAGASPTISGAAPSGGSGGRFSVPLRPIDPDADEAYLSLI